MRRAYPDRVSPPSRSLAPSEPHLPLLEAAGDEAAMPADERPSWRGWIHAGTWPVAVAAGVLLIVLADGALAKTAAAVYAASSWALFGVSAVYHRFRWPPRVKIALKRFDHANIFLLIAGTYTPIALLALPPGQGLVLLGAVWGTAIAGIVFRVAWVTAPRWLYVALYIALGWSAVAFIVPLVRADAAMMVLLGVGGVLYTLGAVVYALKRPDPWPRRFGFHEIFHVFTVLAFLTQWVGVLLIVLHPANG